MSDHSAHNEHILLMKIAEGNEVAFGQLFKIYYNQLGDYMLRITESEQLAQEIVQDVFMKIWINRINLKDIDCFKAYLLVVAKNHAFNCLKQIAREQHRKKEWVNAVLYEAVSQAGEADSTDTGKLIDEAIALLPSQQRKVYTLSKRKGIRQQEIAKELNISHETVKKHMVLAIRFLKNHLRSHSGLKLLIINWMFFL